MPITNDPGLKPGYTERVRPEFLSERTKQEMAEGRRVLEMLSPQLAVVEDEAPVEEEKPRRGRPRKIVQAAEPEAAPETPPAPEAAPDQPQTA